MRNKYMLIGLVGIVVGVLLSSVVVVLAGSLDSSAAPGATSSYTLEDIYNRLNAGTAGSQSTFTEPGSGPGSTMHTLNDIMGKAPAVDDTDGAGVADVASGKTFWGLTSGAWGTQTGTGTIATYAASVPKTGQTECYKSATPWGTCTCGDTNCPSGQDGDLEKGVTWPNPRFTDNSNGTVTDNLTGLIWLKNASCGGTKTWANALTFANSLYDGWTGDGSDGDCGLSDSSTAGQWRLPNVREMQSLVHYGCYSPALPNTDGTACGSGPFTGVQSNVYWSSTTIAISTSLAWRVHLGGGYMTDRGKTYTLYVWPVRGGQ